MANYRKPTIQQSIAPNATLIQGEARLRASQTNNPVGVMNTVANSINKFMVPIMQAAERTKNAADAKWNNWVGKLGPDVDTQGLNAQQTEVIGLASRNLKNDFLQQYQILNDIKDKQSPAYMDAVSQMNKIINDFKGLASFKAGHLEKKDLFTENKKQGNYSNQSQKDGSYNTAVEIYGAGIDGNGSQWALADDGKTILYSTSNGLIKPSDIPDTTLVDYKGANQINDMLSAIDNAGVGLTGSKERQLRSKLDIMFTNPSTLNSAIYDGKIQGVTLDIPEEILNGDPAVLKETVINQIIDSSRTNAAEEQTRRKNSFSGGAGQYYGPQDTGKKDGNGNKIYFRMPKDPNGKIIYTTLDPPGINKETPVETPAETPVSTPSSYDRDGDGIPDSFDVDGGDGTGTPGAFGPRNDPNAKTNTNTATSKKPAGYDQLVNMIKDSAKTKSNPATEEEIKEALTKGPEAMKALIAKYKKK